MAHFFQNGFFGGGFPGGMGGGDEMDMEDKNVDTQKLYDLLEIEKSATQDEVKKAYRKIARKAHPDKGGDVDAFKEINMAYEVLGNEEKRGTYDKYGMEGLSNGGGPAGFEDIFGSMFGGGGGRRSQNQGAKKTKPVAREVSVKLEEVFNGKVVKMPHQKRVCCEACEGKGGKNVKTCTDCKGQGFKIRTQMLGPGMIQQSQVPCNTCKTEGKIYDEKDKCPVCKGEKIKTVEKTLEVPIDKGCPNEKVILFPGEGNEIPGAMPGDLHVRVNVKAHATFERKGADLFMNKKITLLEALTGVNFKIKHLDGQELTICSAPTDVISSGTLKVVQHKGMPFFNEPMCSGHLIIKFEVEFPKMGSMTKDQVEGLKKLLPGPKVAAPPKNHDMLEDFNESMRNEDAEGGKRKQYDEDEEGRGAHRVECGNQ